MVTVLFICVHNAGRSQMSEAIFNSLAGGRHRSISAGSQPSAEVNPLVVQALREIGLDISGNKPKKLTKEMVMRADIAVTMGCGEDACPVVPNELREWKIEDPHGQPIEKVREIRDEIRGRVVALIEELDVQ
ncbi:MAG: arsenate reductase ArsC [Candidatus Bathyarchaeota archaeon]|nr:arsenate reductase ArsC [Candidatus Bathyarchaeota archaeon]